MNLPHRYYDNLSNPRPPGTGCHGWIMSTANLGIMAGKDPDEIFDNMRQAIPSGKRKVTDREITDAINKALLDHKRGTFIPRLRPKPVVKDGRTALNKIISQAKITDEVDLFEASQIRLWDEPQADPALLLETLHQPDDRLFIGERVEPGIPGRTIRSAAAWIDYFRNGGKPAPLIIPNPLNGIPAPVKSGDKTTLRGDGNVQSYRYAMVEFDNLTHEEQIRFWSAVKLPIVALIDSGNKSIHAWIDVQKLTRVSTPEQWQSEIKGRLYDRLLTPLGVDGACSNPARLSRLPGHFRTEKGNFQKLLWLSPEGKSIC